MKHLLDNIIYILIFCCCKLLSLLPYKLLYLLSDGLFPVLFYVFRYRRHVVEKNLRMAFLHKSDAERYFIEKKFYHFLCDYFMETIKLLSVSKEELMQRMVMEGVECFRQSFDKQNMLFVYLGHFCNWEYIASLQWWVEQDVLCSQLYSPLHSKPMDRLFLKIRSRFGGLNIKKKESLRTIMQLYRKGQKTVVGFISDQGPRWVNTHLFMSFLGQDTGVFTGTERIARKVNASIYVAHITRPRRGYYHCKYELLTEDANGYAEHELTKLYMRDLEQQIEVNPHLWLWTHNRWRRQRTAMDAPAEWKATVQDGQIISETPISLHKSEGQ